jgi:hypothetical protein
VEDWRTKAVEFFPGLPDFAEVLTGPYSGIHDLASDLYLPLLDSYDEQPVNDDRIRRNYEFAACCIDQPQSEDVETDLSRAVAVGFIESFPLDRRVTEDLHRWLSVETFRGFEALFRYHLSEKEFRELAHGFMRRKNEYSGPARLSLKLTIILTIV